MNHFVNLPAFETPQQRNKQQVSHQFSRAAATYDQAAQVQARALDGLLRRLQQHRPSGWIQGQWLDIGCGTGKAFEPLRALGAQGITGVDLSEGMLRQAQQRTDDHTHLLLADADALPLQDNSMDGLISSLMLQWSENLTITLQEWARVLKPGGTAAIATLMPGTHQELQQAWAHIDDFVHVNQFSSADQLCHSARKAGLHIKTLEQLPLVEHHPDLRTLLRQLKAIGATNVNTGRQPGLTTRKTLSKLEQNYPRDDQQQLPLTYQAGWLILTKPNNATSEQATL